MLETSVEDFVVRFAAHAAVGQLYPQPEGSPLLEFEVGGRVLYLFDRTGPYTAKPGPAKVIVHGVLSNLQPAAAAAAAVPELTVVGVSGIAGSGQVTQVVSRFTVVLRSRLPLVLSHFTPLPPLREGEWLSFETQPPLHGFLVQALPGT